MFGFFRKVREPIDAIGKVVVPEASPYENFDPYTAVPLPMDTSNHNEYVTSLVKYYLTTNIDEWVIYYDDYMKDKLFSEAIINEYDIGAENFTEFNGEWWIKRNIYEVGEKINIIYRREIDRIYIPGMILGARVEADKFIKDAFFHIVQSAYSKRFQEEDPQSQLDEYALRIQEVELRKAEELLRKYKGTAAE